MMLGYCFSHIMLIGAGVMYTLCTVVDDVVSHSSGVLTAVHASSGYVVFTCLPMHGLHLLLPPIITK